MGRRGDLLLATGGRAQLAEDYVPVVVSHNSFSLAVRPGFGVATACRALSKDEERSLARKYREELIDLLGRFGCSHLSVLLSGGEDSRILAAMAKQAGHQVRGITFLDAFNREYRKASRVAKVLGIDLVPRFRDPRHYNSNLAAVVQAMGLDLDPGQVHSRDLVDPGNDPLPVIDGWYAGLVKGDYSPQFTPKWRGIAVGRSRPTAPGERDARSVDSMRHQAIVRKRREDKAARLSHLDDAACAEWMPQWPATDQGTVSFFLSNQRNAWSLSPFLFRPMVELASSVPASNRLNRSFLKAAFSRPLGLAGLVPRTDGEVLRLPTALDVPCAAMHQLSYRAMLKLDRRAQRTNPGPWPTASETWRSDLSALLACPPEPLRVVAKTSPAAAETIERAQSGQPATLRESLMRLRCAFLAQYLAQVN